MLQSALRQRNNLLQDLRVRARALSVDRSNRKGQVICTSTADVHSFLSCPLILWLGSIQSSAVQSVEAGPATQEEGPESSLCSLTTANEA